MSRKEHKTQESKKSAGKVLGIFCGGTDYNLQDDVYNSQNDSLIERWYEAFQADEIFIRPTQSKSLESADYDNLLLSSSDSEFPESKSLDCADDSLPSELHRIPVSSHGLADKLYLAGPGSAPHSNVSTPGHESPVLGIDKKEIRNICGEVKDDSFKQHFLGGARPQVDADSQLSRLYKGSIKGEGLEDNVDKACTIVCNTIGTDHEYEKIILVGWSRGGVTLFSIAYKLYQLGVRIPVHLFPIDPVAGGDEGVKNEATYTLGDNIESAYIIYAKGDQTLQFTPQGPERLRFVNKQTQKKVTYHSVDGTHSQVAGATKENPLNANCESAKVTTDIFMRFLSKVFGEGQQLLSNPGYTSEDVAESYATMQIFPDTYQYQLDPLKNPLDIIYTKSTRPFLLAPPTGESHHFFVNQHHQEHFAKAYPEIFVKIQKQEMTIDDITKPTRCGASSKKLSHHVQTSLVMAVLLRPLNVQIDKLSKQQYECTALKEELIKLKEVAKKEISDHIYGKDPTEKNWQEKSLRELPAVKLCSSAAEMVKAINDTSSQTTIAAKYAAVTKFSNQAYQFAPTPLKKMAAQITSAAIQFLGVVATVVGTFLGGPAVGNAIYEKTQQARKNVYQFFTNTAVAKQAQKLVVQQEKTLLRYL